MLIFTMVYDDYFVEINLHIFERMVHLCKKTDTLAIIL